MWAIQQQTGWSQEYLLWGESHACIRMKLADALKYKTGEPVKEIEDWDDVTFKCDE